MIIKRERPKMKDYGIETNAAGMLTWDWVQQQMTQSRNYWVCTATPAGNPHAAPVWGLWFDEAFVFGTGPGSRKARNFTTNPNVVIHLESGDDVVIFNGTIATFSVDDATMSRMADAYEAKYKFRPEPDPGSAFYTLEPTSVLAWKESDFPKTATRFTFE